MYSQTGEGKQIQGSRQAGQNTSSRYEAENQEQVENRKLEVDNMT